MKDMQRSDASFESMRSSELPDADDLEAYLWDFLEGAQDNVDGRAAEAAGAQPAGGTE